VSSIVLITAIATAAATIPMISATLARIAATT